MSFVHFLKVASLLSLWFVCASAANIFSTRFLRSCPDPSLLTIVSLFWCFLGWLIYERPSLMSSSPFPWFDVSSATTGCMYLVNTMVTNVLFLQTDVPWVYTMKTFEPTATTLIASISTQIMPPLPLLALCLLIPVGVSLTVFHHDSVPTLDSSNQFHGIYVAVALTVFATSLRSLWFKADLQQQNRTLQDKVMVQFLRAGAAGFVMIFSVWLYSFLFLPSQHTIPIVWIDLLAGSVFHFCYNLFSFHVLEELNPVSHALANVFKRLLSVVTAVMYFDEHLSSFAIAGIVVAHLGLLLYLLLKPLYPSFGKVSVKPFTRQLFALVLFVAMIQTTYTLIQTAPIHLHLNVANDSAVQGKTCLAGMSTQFNKSNSLMRNEGRRQCLSQLGNRLIGRLRGLISPHKPVVLLDFPDYNNLGDSFIYQGEILLLHQLGITPAYQGSMKECERDMKTIQTILLHGGTILMNGGGNFGTLWRPFQTFRMNIANNFQNQTIIFMPQTVFYDKPELLASDLHTLASHPDLHILVRSLDSFDLLKKNWPNPNTLDRLYLEPDAAFVIGDLSLSYTPTTCQAVDDVFFLMRSDKEKSHLFHDAFDEVVTSLASNDIKASRDDWFSCENPGVLPLLDRNFLERRNHNVIASMRVQLGMGMLCRGNMTVVDRLHALILSALIDKPVVYIDTPFKKVSGAWNTWIHSDSSIGCLPQHFLAKEFKIDGNFQPIALVNEIMQMKALSEM